MGLENTKAQQTGNDKIKVLIADDDAPTRILLRAAISQWGYEVVEAGDGEEAWEVLQKPDTPKLLIVDWLMPRLDGIDLCRRIKTELDKYPYIILLTQLSGTTNIIKGLEAGADEFLSKPFNMAELQSRLSVGSRIVRYENAITKHNQELKMYFDQTKQLTEIVTKVASKLDNLISECIKLGEGADKKDQLEKLKELNSDFSNVLEVIKDFSSDQEKQGNS